MKQGSARRVALLGMLFALAMVLSVLESTLTPLLGLPPGVKLGLSNIVVMYAVLFMGWGEALTLAVLKAMFAALTRAWTAGALSLAGGVCSILVMLLLLKLWKNASWYILSVSGALAHNFGQLLMINLLFTQSVYTVYYAPVLLVSGLVMGSITSVSLRAVMPALEKLGLSKK
jgi:heptaprenyl diphosphate synthase